MKKREIVATNPDGEIVQSIDVTNQTELEVVKQTDQLAEFYAVEIQLGNINIEQVETEVKNDKEDRIILPVVFEKSFDKVDNSINLTFNTGEMSDDDYLLMRRLKKQSGVLLFKTTETITEEEHETLDGIKPTWENKSAAQKQRSVMYRIWEIKPDGFKNFEHYYNYKMEELRGKMLIRLEEIKNGVGV